MLGLRVRWRRSSPVVVLRMRMSWSAMSRVMGFGRGFVRCRCGGGAYFTKAELAAFLFGAKDGEFDDLVD